MQTLELGTFAGHLADTLGLDVNTTQVRDAIYTHRDLWENTLAITPAEQVALARAVWADLTDGADYPSDWAADEDRALAAYVADVEAGEEEREMARRFEMRVNRGY